MPLDRVVDDTDGVLTYRGSWTLLQGSTRQWEGTIHSTTSPGASVSFQFRGFILRIFHTIPNGSGEISVDVVVDGGAPIRLTRSAQPEPVYADLLYETTSLSDFSMHTVLITNRGSSAPFNFDRVQVETDQGIPPVSSWAPSDSNPGTSNPGTTTQPSPTQNPGSGGSSGGGGTNNGGGSGGGGTIDDDDGDTSSGGSGGSSNNGGSSGNNNGNNSQTGNNGGSTRTTGSNGTVGVNTSTDSDSSSRTGTSIPSQTQIGASGTDQAQGGTVATLTQTDTVLSTATGMLGDQNADERSSGPPVGPIVGGVVGAVVVLALLIFFLLRRARRKRQGHSVLEEDAAMVENAKPRNPVIPVPFGLDITPREDSASPTDFRSATSEKAARFHQDLQLLETARRMEEQGLSSGTMLTTTSGVSESVASSALPLAGAATAIVGSSVSGSMYHSTEENAGANKGPADSSNALPEKLRHEYRPSESTGFNTVSAYGGTDTDVPPAYAPRESRNSCNMSSPTPGPSGTSTS